MLRMRVEGIVMARAGDWYAYRERFRQEAAMLVDAGDEMRAWGALYHVALAEVALQRPQAAVQVLEPVVQRLREVGLLREQWTRPAALLIARIEAGEGMAAAAAVREVVTLLRVAGAPTWIADHLSLWVLDIGDAEAGGTPERLGRRGDCARTRAAQLARAHGAGACGRTARCGAGCG